MVTEMPSDEEALRIIKALQKGGYITEEEQDSKLHYLEHYYHEIGGLIFTDERELTADQILEEAKQKRDNPLIL